jgi:beta-glucanase (GH16 family)
VFDSEFNGSSLNTEQWSTGFFGSGITRGDNSVEQECYDPAQVVVANDMLSLTAVAKPERCGHYEPYASGMVMTYGKFNFTYGYMEARIWLSAGPDGIADWPAFWAVGQNWPTDGEIDVLEGLGGQACVHFITHRGHNPGTCAPGDFSDGWHTYAADWEPGSINFYYDGKKIYTVTAGVTSAPMYLVLNLALTPVITSPDTAPATMLVDYVRVWQH